MEMKSVFASETKRWRDTADSNYRVTHRSYVMNFLDTS